MNQTLDQTQDSCPLCNESDSIQIESIRVSDINSEYMRQFGVDVLNEFPSDMKLIHLRRCKACSLDFFSPTIVGSENFYAAIGQAPGYYTSDRWEFKETIRRLPENANLIDVGCGDGVFLRHVPGDRKRGLEFNPDAVKRAQEKGLLVEQASLESLPAESADFVTLFHVLEHVRDPAKLAGEIARVLRPGGRLFVAVPNTDSYIGSAIHDPMNAPPHHPLRWRAAAFEHLQTLVPLRIKRMDTEPLNDEHLYHYRRARCIAALSRLAGGRLPLHRVGLGMTIIRRTANIWSHSLKYLAQAPAQGTPGPSLLVEFQRA